MADKGSSPTYPIGLEVLRGTPGWQESISLLRKAWEQGGADATSKAREIRTNFRGKRGLMVLDVVLSNQRRYRSVVVPLLNRWLERVSAADGEPSLAWLTANPESYADLSLKRTEADTIAGVTAGLLRYGVDHDLVGEDAACEGWADGTRGLEVVHLIDPYVGSVKGIGPALFAYCRMLAGGDTIKPDVRVLKQLKKVGLRIPVSDGAAAYVVACAVAYELGISVIELDQLLWYLEDK